MREGLFQHNIAAVLAACGAGALLACPFEAATLRAHARLRPVLPALPTADGKQASRPTSLFGKVRESIGITLLGRDHAKSSKVERTASLIESVVDSRPIGSGVEQTKSRQACNTRSSLFTPLMSEATTAAADVVRSRALGAPNRVWTGGMVGFTGVLHRLPMLFDGGLMTLGRAVLYPVVLGIGYETSTRAMASVL